MKKRQYIIIISFIGILLLAFSLSAFFSSLKKPTIKKKPPVTKKYVETTPVRYEDIEANINTYGRVENFQTIDLIPEVSGRLSRGSILFKVGDKFKKNDLLFKIDDSEAILNLKALKSDFLRDLAGILPDFKVDFPESFEIWKKYFNDIAVDKILTALPEAKSDKEKTFLATKGIYTSFYTIKSAEVRLAKYKYHAPFDGSLVEVVLQLGSFVNPGTKIGKIAHSSLYELRASVQTRDVEWVKMGSPVQIFAEESQIMLDGQVSRISDYVNQNTQSVDVFIKIFLRNMKIFDGQFFKVTIPGSTIKNVMRIPRNVIYNGSEVFVLQDSLLKVKNIDIIHIVNEDAICQGLDTGVLLVKEPLVGAYNNMIAFSKDQKKDSLLENKNEKSDADSVQLNE